MAAKDMESMRWQETAMPCMVQGLVIDVGLGTRSDVDQIHGVRAWLSPVMIRKTSLKETAANTGHERPQEAFGQPIVLKCVVRCRRMLDAMFIEPEVKTHVEELATTISVQDARPLRHWHQ